VRYFLLLVLCSCVTPYEECEGYEGEALKTCNDIAREYDRVDYLESVFRPQLASCERQGGHSQWSYHGAPSVRMQKAIQLERYEYLSKMEMRQWGCCMSGICGAY